VSGPRLSIIPAAALDASVRDKVDALLKLNVDYPKWTAGAPDEKTAKLYAFVHAATWADDIKTKDYGYARDNVNSATAGQNIGYTDHNQHAYWHFKDINFSPDGTPLAPPDPVELTPEISHQLSLMRAWRAVPVLQSLPRATEQPTRRLRPQSHY
jgi:hypothetical protein